MYVNDSERLAPKRYKLDQKCVVFSIYSMLCLITHSFVPNEIKIYLRNKLRKTPSQQTYFLAETNLIQ